jgi:hypothetical protein
MTLTPNRRLLLAGIYVLSLSVFPPHSIWLYIRLASIVLIPLVLSSGKGASEICSYITSKPYVYLFSIGMLDLLLTLFADGNLSESLSRSFFLLISPLTAIVLGECKSYRQRWGLLMAVLGFYLSLCLLSFILIRAGRPSFFLTSFLSYQSLGGDSELASSITRNTESGVGFLSLQTFAKAPFLVFLIPLVNYYLPFTPSLFASLLVFIVCFASLSKVPLAISVLSYFFVRIRVPSTLKVVSIKRSFYSPGKFIVILLLLILPVFLIVAPVLLQYFSFGDIYQEIVYVLSNPFQSQTFAVRSMWFYDYFDFLADHPWNFLFGIGTGNCFETFAYGTHQCITSVENSFFDLFIRNGIIVLALLIYVIYGCFRIQPDPTLSEGCLRGNVFINHVLLIQAILISFVNPYFLSFTCLYLLGVVSVPLRARETCPR